MSSNIYSDGEYLEQNPTWHVEDSSWKVEQIINIIRSNSLEPGSVCEIGCGAGEILNQMHSRMNGDIQFTGYEISPQAYKLCESRAKEKLQFHLKDPFEGDGDHYDIVMAIDVIEHVEDYYDFLRKIKKKGALQNISHTLGYDRTVSLQALSYHESSKSGWAHSLFFKRHGLGRFERYGL